MRLRRALPPLSRQVSGRLGNDRGDPQSRARVQPLPCMSPSIQTHVEQIKRRFPLESRALHNVKLVSKGEDYAADYNRPYKGGCVAVARRHRHRGRHFATVMSTFSTSWETHSHASVFTDNSFATKILILFASIDLCKRNLWGWKEPD
ncbi:hypothetical protein J6590_028651 [Homalodisca vitripennis]|nr:hypothetical protein J6590_028651 [Homalodisca vitripennis]